MLFAAIGLCYLIFIVIVAGEDASRIRNGSAPQIMAAIRNAVIGLLRSEKVLNIAATLRENAWNSHRLFTKLGRWNK